ncbi:hypothetical protein [Haladaptatus halobius]|uniref:hypothetical protein n=1 Tax=Haladaptatus halobius TaxID=2884875 RepID=UPI001D0AB273|nr:hypothetical protein [Haladaptatus halobius]
MTNQIEPHPPERLPKYLADGLPKQSTETLEDTLVYLEQLIEWRNRPLEADDLPDSVEPVDDEESSGGKGTLVKERVKCGADCTCNDGNGHGPYLYRYFREKGTMKSEYVGKA